MIRAKYLQDMLLHVIGWEQNYDTSDLKISDNLTISESGMYYQQAHPLLTIANISSIAPDFKNINFEIYSNEKQYDEGVIVKFENSLYKSKEKVIGIEPNNSSYWYETNLLSEWIESKTKSSIIKVISRFCNEKSINKTLKTLCENRTLFDNTSRITDIVQNKNNLVGFEVVPIRAKGITTKINKIGFQSNGIGKFDIYVMHSSMYEPFDIIHVDKQKSGFIWIDTPDLYLPYESNEIESGGSWYICYKQTELKEQKAIRKDKDWSKEPCGACSRREILAWSAWSKYLEIHPFRIDESNFENNQMWDVENNIYTYDNNYGLNLDITISCDITDIIVQQKMLFQDVLLKQFAIDMLREFAYNTNVRTNRHSINASRVDILYEIDGDSSSLKKSGLSYQLELSYKSIKLVMTGLDRVCLPCNNNGVKYNTV